MANNQKLLDREPASAVESPTSSNSSNTSASSTSAPISSPLDQFRGAGQLMKLIEFRKRQESANKRLKASEDNQQIFRKEPPAIISQSYSKNIQRASMARASRQPAGKQPEGHSDELQSDVNKQPPATATTTTTIRAILKEPTILLTATQATVGPKAGSPPKALALSQQPLDGTPATPTISAGNPNTKELAMVPKSCKLFISSAATTQQRQQPEPKLDKAASLDIAAKLNSRPPTPCSSNTTSAHTTSAKTSVSPSNIERCESSPDSANLGGLTQTGSIAAGLAVSARLMDMGKKLLEAARDGHTDLVRQLVVSAGAPFTSDWLGTTALHLAAQNGHLEVAEILLTGGVNRDARTKLERTALHCAAQSGSVDIVNLLLLHGSDVNACDMLKMTPLHWAVERGHYLVAERLLLDGADVSAINKFQLTPIEIAQRSESYEMICLFQRSVRTGSSGIIAESTPSADYIDPRNFNITRSPGYLTENIGHSDLSSFLNINFSTDDKDFNESHDITDQLNCRLSFENQQSSTNGSSRTSLNFDITEPCIDLVEFELNTLKFEPDFFLSNEDEDGYEEEEEEDDEEDETKVEYLMKVVENLQKENKQLRQTVEHLQTTK